MSFKVVGIGEVLWDLLPSGPQLGGAPGNFAYHARQLNAKANVISRVGDDEYGRRVIQRFEEMDIDGGTVQVDPYLPTGTASVVLGGDGTPQFTIRDGVAWDSLALTDEALKAVRNANAVCFGTLAQRTPAAGLVIQQLVGATQPASLRVFDVNLRQGNYNWKTVERSLATVNVVKMNDHELAVLSPRLELAGTVNQMISQLAERFDLELVAVTRAEQGSLLYQHGNWSEFTRSQDGYRGHDRSRRCLYRRARVGNAQSIQSGGYPSNRGGYRQLCLFPTRSHAGFAGPFARRLYSKLHECLKHGTPRIAFFFF